MWRWWYEIKQWWMLGVGLVAVAVTAVAFDTIQSGSELTEYEVHQAFAREALQECVLKQMRGIPDEDFILADRSPEIMKSIAKLMDECQRVNPEASLASPH